MLDNKVPETDLQSSASVRAYTAGDRAAVRFICAETADSGRPLERLFLDSETIADMVTRYYTDYEPECLWVADFEGEVVGYLSGAMDTHRMQRVTRLRVYPRAAAAAISRGSLLRIQGWRLLWCALRTAPGLHTAMQRVQPVVYPAHMHINILPAFRGRNIGSCLLRSFLAKLREGGVCGLHAAVREDNRPACAFFQRAGFHVVENYAIHLPRPERIDVTQVAIYARHTCSSDRCYST